MYECMDEWLDGWMDGWRIEKKERIVRERESKRRLCFVRDYC